MNNSLNSKIEIGISGIRNLVSILKESHGFDLGCFALTSFKRRVIRTMQENEINCLNVFADKLAADKSFFEKFLKDIDVECTEFFRDPPFWRYFRDEMLPTLDKNHKQIKIWVPGCSSGEELITLAIVIEEAGLKHKTKITGTDISPSIIRDLENKVYSRKKIEISETNYQRFNEEKTSLLKYTLPGKTGFKIVDHIYENMIFDIYKYQNAKKIGEFNLIIFRNILIYYTQECQEMILGLFADNLANKGYLVIGNMENISWCKDFYRFTEVNQIERVYKKTC